MEPRKSHIRKKYFDYLESKGKMPKASAQDPGDSDEFEHFSHGGMVEDESDNYDYEMGHQSEYNSSGDPHTEDKLEDEHPMEYMSNGGKVRRMAKGGLARPSGFIQAIRKKMY